MTQQERLEAAIHYSIETNCSVYDNYIKVRNRVTTAPKICIFGLGKLFSEFSKVVFKELFAAMNIVCVSDDDEEKWGKEFLGVPCLPPQELAQTEDLTVVITAEDYLSVIARMEKMNLESYFIGDCYSCYFDEPKDVRWMEDSSANILKAYTLLEDERSKEIYVELFCQKFAPHLATQEFYKFCEPDEYFYKDLIHLSQDECFVDCGAYIGDTIENFLHECGGKYKSIVAFEPDQLNYAVALNMIKERRLDRVTLYNCGLSDKNSHPLPELLQMKNREGLPTPVVLPDVSMIAVNIKKVAPDVRMGRLDDLIGESDVTFLKIDVEGFEEQTLNGATKLISAQRPTIALCIYHQMQHLWTLPLMLHELRPDYKLYIRHHSAMGYDTVCYAI